MIIGRQFVKNQYEDERLYSTGNDELDEMLEKAFCEGYEYAQKEFGRTGLTAQQAKQFFTKTNTQASKAIRDTAVMNNNKAFGQNVGKSAARGIMHSSGSTGQASFIKDSRKLGANPVDLSINTKAGLSLGGNRMEGVHNPVLSKGARTNNPRVRDIHGGTKNIIKGAYGL